MDLSIVDLAPVPEGGTATEAYENTVELARLAEELGYTRFWMAEHHGMTDSIASTTPETLIAHLAAETDEIRVGSGTVLLNHYQPFKVAETFSSLDALAPGRVDLGLGRATGIPAADRALGTDRQKRNPDEDHAEKIDATVSHLYDGFPDDHAYADLQLPRSADDVPEVWVLGSSPSSAEIAGELGLRYCFAGFIRPTLAERAFETYRDTFEPSPLGAGPDEPTGMLAMNVACGDSDDDAARLRATAEASYKRMRRGVVGSPPSVEAAIEELGGVPEPTPNPLPDGDWPRSISGSPETVAELLEQLTDRVGVDDVVVQNIIADHDDVLRSHELLADGVGL
ncbi:LLM class flavin-dependent oxidoreductase [Natrinema longum]|uniref:LLM class flavin-dependent oxidoreductase n=1 Tax=Natrinema longum TaxID=370324 RepID=A0A8A2UCG9_9EURY|nr:LLM class flavin-dependent oxidoreductase [Natrinema longum]MBZ6496202.1 LLM class flavin-dependent oxidoreductase [Natrinema longum]QSW85875.1 LLM class flavin-dependent oxidoreductase [Natrinema longum]